MEPADFPYHLRLMPISFITDALQPGLGVLLEVDAGRWTLDWAVVDTMAAMLLAASAVCSSAAEESRKALAEAPEGS